MYTPQLHHEQSYITEIAREKGIGFKLLQHQRETITCSEKAELLGWDVGRVIKALYFEDKGGHTIGIIVPENGQRINTTNLLSSIQGLDLTRAESSRYKLARVMPYGMVLGTGTPFPYESAVEQGGINELVVLSRPELDEQLVDISIGGTDKRVSMHIQHSGIFELLKEKFGDMVHKG